MTGSAPRDPTRRSDAPDGLTGPSGMGPERVSPLASGQRFPIRAGCGVRQFCRSVRSSGTVAVLALVLSGQVLLQTVGRLLPSAVRYPGSWAPTMTEDSGVYLNAAAGLPQVELHLWTKVLYLYLIRVDASLGLQGWGLVMLQVLLLIFAGLGVLKYVEARWGRRAGLFAVAALALNPNITQWTKTIFTEAVFMPLAVIIVIAAAIALEKASLKTAVLLLAGFSAAVRPNGIGMLLGIIVLFSLSARRWRAVRLATGIVFLALLVILSPALQTAGGDENSLAARTYEGLVIWVSPDYVRTDMPTPSDASDLSNTALVGYVLQHPLSVLRLAALRVFWEIAQVRAHYPATINAIVILQMIAFVALAGVGLFRSRRDPLTRSVIAVSAGLFLVIAATWAIAEGRFGWAVFATWSPWVGIGADAVLPQARGGRR
jgi:hypothetical protein